MSQVLETDRLRTLSRLAIELGSRALAAEAEALAERLREGRFYVASVGQFKRGKSTLLNALVGAPLLPAGVVPITAAVTVLRHGERVAARVRLGERPIEETRARVGALRAAVAEAERSLEELGHRLAGVQERLSRTFTGERDRFFRLALPEAERELRERVRADGGADRGLRSRAMDHARAVARRWLERWRTEQEPRAEALYQEAVTRFVELVDEFRDRLMQVGVGGVSGVAAETGLRSRSRFHFTEMLAVAPARRPVLDVIASRRHRLRRAERQAAAYLERLLEVNSARVKNDFRERVEESRRLLEQEIRGGLAEIAASAQRALAAASSAHAAGGEAVEARLAWLRRLRSRVESPPRVEV